LTTGNKLDNRKLKDKKFRTEEAVFLALFKINKNITINEY
jgi:hypothetical protein